MRLLLPVLLLLQVCCTAAIVPPAGPQEATFQAPGLTWSLPIKVAGSGYADTSAISFAAEAWNQWLGVDVFTPAAEGQEPDLIILAVPEKNPVFAGYTDAQIVAGRPRGVVYMYVGYHHRVDIIAHELGHVLGLAHDAKKPWSVMDGQPSWILSTLTLADCRALAEKYRLSRPPCLLPYDGAR